MSSNLKVNSLVPATGTEIGIGTTGGSIDFRCPATFGGNVTIGGTLTYDEVINIDSIGIITARGVIDAQGYINLAQKIIHTGDADTSIEFDTNTIKFETAGSERLRIDSAGLVGIGITNPISKIGVQGTGNGSTGSVNLGDTAAAASLFLKTHSGSSTGLALGGRNTGGQYIQGEYQNSTVVSVRDLSINPYGGGVGIGTLAPNFGANPGADTIVFGTSQTERLRIDSSGSLLINSTSNNGASNAGQTPVLYANGYSNLGGLRVKGGDDGNTIYKEGGDLCLVTGSAHSIILKTAGGEQIKANNDGRVITTTNQSVVGLLVKNSSHDSRLQIYAEAANKNSTIWFGDAADDDIGIIDYDHNDNSMSFTTNTEERLRIRSDGRVQVKSGSAEVIAGEGASAELRLTADEGDDGADYWKIQSNHSTNNLNIATYATGAYVDKFSMKTDGDIVATGNLQTNNLSGRNIVINGDMRVAQRATSASMSNHGGTINVCDRWIYSRHGVTATLAQVAEAPAGRGFKYSLKWTSTSAVGSIAAGNTLKFAYNIERQDIQRLGYGSSNAKKATLSFWAKGSLAGKIGVSCTRNSRITSHNVDMTANTWEFHEIVIPIDTSTALSGTDTDSGFYIGICWGGGGNSTSGATNGWIGFHNAYTSGFTAGQQGAYLTTSGSTFQITGVQLEVGSVSTPFEHRSYADQLHDCMRYYYKLHNADGDQLRFVGYGGGGTSAGFTLIHNPPMRDTPNGTLTVSSGTLSYNDGTAAYSGTGGWSFNGNRFCCDVNTSTNAGTNAMRGKGLSIYTGGSGTSIELDAEF